MKNLKIGQKFILSFALIQILFISVTIFTLVNNKKLSTLQDLGADRASHAIYVSGNVSIGAKTYLVIANTIINKDEMESTQAWADIKKDNDEIFKKIEEIVDTDKEREDLEASVEIYNKIVKLHENQILPLVFENSNTNKLISDSIVGSAREQYKMAKIASLDAEMDLLIVDLEKNLLKIVKSIANESDSGDLLFDETINSSQFWTLILVAITILLSIIFIIFIQKNIRNIIDSILKEIKIILRNALDGNLSFRAEVEKINFEFREVGVGINNILDALINPLNVAADYVNRISKGDLPEIISKEYNGDFNTIKNNLNIMINVQQEIILKAKLIAQGDLTVKLEKRSNNDELLKALAQMLSRINEIVTQINEGSENVASSSLQISSTANQIAQGASEQAASAEQVSASIEEMTSSIQQNTENAIQTEKIALKAANSISEGQKSFEKTLQALKIIASKINIISDIAEKTDILALNAAIEAARAGENGKGFAVVAAEVRKLAESSQKAANEIIELSEQSVDVAQNSGRLLAEIVPDVQRTAQLVQEITASSSEQNVNAQQIAKAVEQFSQVTQQNSAAAEEMSTGSEELSSQAEMLKDVISFFKIEKRFGNYQSKYQQQHKLTTKANYTNKGVTLNLSDDDLKDSEFEKI